jgi:RNA polymerase sigma-70 factor (ECF subfamily)
MNVPMDFDAGFVTRLQQRDPEACTSLITALTPVLDARLRYRHRDPSVREDVRNETWYRVFCLLDRGRVREPAQLGSFVRGVCDRVAQETRRKARVTEPLDCIAMEPADRWPHLDKLLIEQERAAVLWRALMQLSEADRGLIVELHWEERDRRDLARERGVGNTVLNTRLCRALKRLRKLVLLPEPAAKPACRPRACSARRARGPRACHAPAHADAGARDRWATMAA